VENGRAGGDTTLTDFAVTHPLRPLVLASNLTWAMYAAAAAIVFMLCRPYVPSATLVSWSVAAATFVTAWGTINAAVLIRNPDAEELVRTWSRAARFIIYGSNVIVVLAIWLLLPSCPRDVQLMLGLFFAFNSPMQVIASPENVLANRVGILAVGGSLVLWFGSTGHELHLLFALFAGGIGLGLFVLADVIPKTVGAVVSERLASDEAARRLETALAEVASERDAKTRFIASASHDLGQPLQAAALFFDQVQRAPDASLRAIAATGVVRALASADQLLSHMLNHLRLEADAVEPMASSVVLGPILRRLAGQCAPAAAEAGMAIKVVDSQRIILVDPALFDRAIGNLIGNAVLHSNGTRILIGATLRSGGLRIWVIDDGRGVGRSDARHLFDDYYRGAEALVPGKGGFGLGLGSVRRIAGLLGGSAGLDSRWTSGAAFYVELPAIGGGRFGLSRRRQERTGGSSNADMSDSR